MSTGAFSIVICTIFKEGQGHVALLINSSNLSTFDQITIHPKGIVLWTAHNESSAGCWKSSPAF